MTLDRKTYMGSSDAAPACGLSPFATPLDVYHAKRDGSPELDTMPIRFGTFNEPFVLSEFTRATGIELESHQAHKRHPEYEFIGATLDALTSDGQAIVEAKTTSMQYDELPKHILIQVQEQLACAGLKMAFVPVLMRGRDFRIFEVEANETWQEWILEKMARLWIHVQEGDPPPPMTLADVRSMFPESEESRLMASDEVIELCEGLTEIKRQIAELSDKKDVVEAAIQGEMGKHSTLVNNEGKILATWKSSKPGARFDAKALKEAMPEVHAQFTKQTNGSRRFILK